LDPSIHKKLIPHNTQTPKIYGQSKIHTKKHPLRPIVSSIGTPIYALVDKFNPSVEKLPHLSKIIPTSFKRLIIFTLPNKTS
jgi:hypothetical protein